MMKMASGDDSPLRQGAGTGLQMVFLRYRGLWRRRRSSRFISGGFSIYRIFQRWNHAKRGHRGTTRHLGARGGLARPGGLWGPCGSSAPPTKLHGSLLVQKTIKKFRPIPRTFISAQKTTPVVLLKTRSVRVCSNQIMPKPYRIVINMA